SRQGDAGSAAAPGGGSETRPGRWTGFVTSAGAPVPGLGRARLPGRKRTGSSEPPAPGLERTSQPDGLALEPGIPAGGDRRIGRGRTSHRAAAADELSARASGVPRGLLADQETGMAGGRRDSGTRASLAGRRTGVAKPGRHAVGAVLRAAGRL